MIDIVQNYVAELVNRAGHAIYGYLAEVIVTKIIPNKLDFVIISTDSYPTMSFSGSEPEHMWAQSTGNDNAPPVNKDHRRRVGSSIAMSIRTMIKNHTPHTFD